MRLGKMVRKKKMKNAHLPKINGDISATLCSDDSIQILLKLASIVTRTIQVKFYKICTES